MENYVKYCEYKGYIIYSNDDNYNRYRLYSIYDNNEKKFVEYDIISVLSCKQKITKMINKLK